MQKLIILLFAFSGTLFCQAQKLNYNQFEMLRIANSPGSSVVTFNNQYNDITGNAFLFETWKDGQAVSNYNSNRSKIKMKIDLYKSKIFINIHDTVYDVTDAVSYNTFILFPNEGDTLEKILLAYEPKITGAKNNFVQILNTGRLKLVKHQFKEIKEIQTGAYSAKEKQFMDYISYYVMDPQRAPVEVKINKKSMEKLFTPEEWNNINQFAKGKGVSYNKEQDWITIFNFYNNQESIRKEFTK